MLTLTGENSSHKLLSVAVGAQILPQTSQMSTAQKVESSWFDPGQHRSRNPCIRPHVYNSLLFCWSTVTFLSYFICRFRNHFSAGLADFWNQEFDYLLPLEASCGKSTLNHFEGPFVAVWMASQHRYYTLSFFLYKGSMLICGSLIL